MHELWSTIQHYNEWTTDSAASETSTTAFGIVKVLCFVRWLFLSYFFPSRELQSPWSSRSIGGAFNEGWNRSRLNCPSSESPPNPWICGSILLTRRTMRRWVRFSVWRFFTSSWWCCKYDENMFIRAVGDSIRNFVTFFTKSYFKIKRNFWFKK